MRKPSRILTITFLALVLHVLPAQQQAATESGVKPFGSFDGSNAETVNLENGQLTLHEPLYSLPQRGGLSLSFSLSYQNAVYKSVTTCVLHKCTTRYSPDLSNMFGVQIDFDQGLKNVILTNEDTGQQYCYGGTCVDYMQAAYSVAQMDGTNHNLAYNGTYYYTVDGSRLAFFPQSTGTPPYYPPSETAGQVVAQTGTIIGPTGNQYAVTNGAVGKITDVDGNYMTINSPSSITDTLGRTVPFPGNGTSTSTSNCPVIGAQYQTLTTAIIWSPPGYQGNTNYIICWASMHVSTGPDVPLASIYGYHANVSVIQSIVRPDGTYWGFVYAAANPNDSSSVGLGDLTQIIYPTGGSANYSWEGFAPGCTSTSGNSNSPGGMTTLWPDAVATRTLSANGANSTWAYSYGESGVTTVTDPLGDQIVHTFTNLSQFSCSLYETQTQYYQATSNGLSNVKTVNTAYQSATGYDTTENAVAFPTQVTTTWPNGQSHSSLTAYDTGTGYSFYICAYTGSWYCRGGGSGIQVPYGKVVSESNYDYSGNLLNQTQTQYLWQSNANYLNANLLDTPSTVTEYGSAGQSGGAIAQTTFAYDESAKVRISPQQSVNTQIGAPPGNAYGHATTKTRWLNAGGASPSSSTYWLNTGEVDHTVDPNGNPTYFVYSSTFAGAYLTQLTNAKGQSTSYGYDFNSGAKTSVTDPNSQTTTYSYDAMSRIVSASYPDTGNTTNTYNPAGYPQNSILTKILMCNGGANCSPEESSGQTESTLEVYDGLGRPIESAILSDPSGQPDYTMTTYDALGRVASVTNQYRTTSDSTYGTTSYQYDSLNRMASLTHSLDSTSQTLAYNGNETTSTDETGRVWERFSDALGRLTEVLEPDGSTTIGKAPSLESDYQYDGLGDLVRVDQWGGPHGSNGDRVRTFVYDSLGRLTNGCNPEALSPGSTCTTSGPWSNVYAYDANSNILTETDGRNLTNQYSYDQLNRVQVETNPSGTPNACFWYDTSSVSPAPSGCPAPPTGLATGNYLVGRMAYEWTSDEKTGTGFGYDQMGRTNSEVVCTPSTCGTSTYSTAFQYDLAGNETSYGNGVGVTTTVAYDTAGRTSQVTSTLHDANHPGTLWTANAYGPIGLTQATLGNGIVENVAYDARARRTSDSFLTPGNQTVYSYALTYYANDSIQSANDSANGAWTYTFDNMNRLYTASASTGPFAGTALQWGIDQWGNRNTQTVTAGSAPQPSFSSTANNQIFGYCYDAAGHLVDEGTCINGTQQFTYDGVGRIISPDFGSTVYIYDASGRRVAKQSGGVSTYEYLYNVNGDQMTELTPHGQSLWNRGEVYAGGRHIATYYGGTTYFAHTSWLGDERVHSNLSDGTQDSCANLPYGDDLTCPIYGVTPLHFTGKERDTESGNDYFGARFYSSTMGRFMSPDWSAKADPVPYAKQDNPQTLNLYVYVGNDSVSRVDPDGHQNGLVKDGTAYGDNSASGDGTPASLSCQNGGGEDAVCGYEAQSDENSTVECAGPCAAFGSDGAQEQGTKSNQSEQIGQRVVQGLTGAANLLDAGLRARGLVSAVAALAETPPAAATLAVYGVVSITGQSISGTAQVAEAITGNSSGIAHKAEQVGDMLSGPAAGLITAAKTRDLSKAASAGNTESCYTAGAGLVDKSVPLIQRVVEFGMSLLQ